MWAEIWTFKPDKLLGAPSGVHHSEQQAEPATRHTAFH